LTLWQSFIIALLYNPEASSTTLSLYAHLKKYMLLNRLYIICMQTTSFQTWLELWRVLKRRKRRSKLRPKPLRFLLCQKPLRKSEGENSKMAARGRKQKASLL
jgi:hypothetical protein